MVKKKKAKRCASGWIIFSQECRKKLMEAAGVNPNSFGAGSEFMKQCGLDWRAMKESNPEKIKAYNQRAKEECEAKRLAEEVGEDWE